MTTPKDFNEAANKGADIVNIADRETFKDARERDALADAKKQNGQDKEAVPKKNAVGQILSSKELVAGFTPPDYLIDGILQRRFLYSMTAPTGSGKTALALSMAAHVALGKSLGGNEVEKGRCLYFAGENPDDIRMRWIAMADEMDFDIETIGAYFLPGRFSIPEFTNTIRAQTKKIGGFQLVIVDTSAAYFQGEDENSNTEGGKHAYGLRLSLTNLPGKPSVILCCHPTKNAGNDNLLPRGAGAFIAEMDGNLVCKKRDSVVDLHWQGKFRGPDFAPIGFELETINNCAKLKDTKGQFLTTVMARPLTDLRRSKLEKAVRNDGDAVLMTLAKTPRLSLRAICEANDWTTSKGKWYISRADRPLQDFRKLDLVTLKRDGWELTTKGEKEVKLLENGGK